MTPDHDIERVLDRWFTEGPTQMPDRFLDDTLDRIDRAPHRDWLAFERLLKIQGPNFAWPRRPGSSLVAVGIGGVLLTQSARVGAEPSASPSVPTSPGPVPAALQDAWHLGGERQGLVREREPPSSRRDWRPDVTIGPSEVIIPAGSADLVSSASLVQPDDPGPSDVIHLAGVGLPARGRWNLHVPPLAGRRARLTLTA